MAITKSTLRVKMQRREHQGTVAAHGNEFPDRTFQEQVAKVRSGQVAKKALARKRDKAGAAIDNYPWQIAA
jgi:hypothetical protein